MSFQHIPDGGLVCLPCRHCGAALGGGIVTTADTFEATMEHNDGCPLKEKYDNRPPLPLPDFFEQQQKRETALLAHLKERIPSCPNCDWQPLVWSEGKPTWDTEDELPCLTCSNCGLVMFVIPESVIGDQG